MTETRSKKSVGERVKTIVIYFILSLPIILCLLFTYAAWDDWHLRQDLAQRGVLTQVIVQDCSSYKSSCTATYEFSVIEEGQVKKYSGKERNLRCSDCSSYMSGEAIALIRYDPYNPNRSGLEGRSHFEFYMLCGVIGPLIVFLMMVGGVYGRTIKTKVQAWWSERKR